MLYCSHSKDQCIQSYTDKQYNKNYERRKMQFLFKMWNEVNSKSSLEEGEWII